MPVSLSQKGSPCKHVNICIFDVQWKIIEEEWREVGRKGTLAWRIDGKMVEARLIGAKVGRWLGVEGRENGKAR